ncbi:MAG TPA: dTMP kinase [Thermoplasmata archaeon]|nr:dTMP kinase [Thermoplasmata archaeon]
MTQRGTLIAVEGIDGSGKSTVVRALQRRWRAAGWRVAVVREPNDTFVRRTAVATGDRNPSMAAMLFTLDRLRSRPELETRLEENDVVLQDRSFFSTLAYQGSALPPLVRRELERLQRQIAVAPDWVVLLDLSPTEALHRVDSARRGRTALERGATLARVARAYRTLARGPRWLTVDASPATTAVAAEVERRLRPKLHEPRRAKRSRAADHRSR